MTSCDDYCFRPWSDLPGVILEQCSERVASYGDNIRYGAVCRSWRSAAAESRQRDPALRFLGRALSQYGLDAKTTRGLVGFAEGKLHMLALPTPRGRMRLVRTLEGMAFYRPQGYFDLMPFQASRVTAPHVFMALLGTRLVRKWRQAATYLRKWVLLMDHNLGTSKSISLAIYNSRRLAFCTKGGAGAAWSKWVLLSRWEEDYLYEDVIIYGGLILAITRKKELWVLEFVNRIQAERWENSPPPICSDPGGRKNGETIYLVRSAGDILMVIRYLECVAVNPKKYKRRDCTCRSIWFRIFQLDLTGDPKWVTVESLGDKMLFLSTSCSRSYSATSIVGFRANCIYFTDDRFPDILFEVCGPYPSHDLHVFRLGKASKEVFSPSDSHSIGLPPIWVIPRS